MLKSMDLLIKSDLVTLTSTVICQNNLIAQLNIGLVKEVADRVLASLDNSAPAPPIVCVLPEGVTPTREEWARIADVWRERFAAGSAPLTEAEVMSIIRPSDY